MIPIIEKKMLQGLIGSIGYCNLNTHTNTLTNCVFNSVTTDLDINAATIVNSNSLNAIHFAFSKEKDISLKMIFIFCSVVSLFSSLQQKQFAILF